MKFANLKNSWFNKSVKNTSINLTLGLQDDVRLTKKQTTINSKNNGNIKGVFEKSSAGYEKPENTTKDSTLFSYTGAGGGHLHGDMNKHNYMNDESPLQSPLIEKYKNS